MVLEQDQPMVGLTILEQVAGSHCMRPLNPAVYWTRLTRAVLDEALRQVVPEGIKLWQGCQQLYTKLAATACIHSTLQTEQYFHEEVKKLTRDALPSSKFKDM